MRKDAMVKIFLETVPIIIGVALTYFLWENNLLLTIVFTAMLTATLTIKRYPGDIFALIYGSVLGFALEVFQTSIAKFHSFSNPDILGIPIWMPLVWGYGFVLMKRIGTIIYEDARSHHGMIKN